MFVHISRQIQSQNPDTGTKTDGFTHFVPTWEGSQRTGTERPSKTRVEGRPRWVISMSLAPGKLCDSPTPYCHLSCSGTLLWTQPQICAGPPCPAPALSVQAWQQPQGSKIGWQHPKCHTNSHPHPPTLCSPAIVLMSSAAALSAERTG